MELIVILFRLAADIVRISPVMLLATVLLVTAQAVTAEPRVLVLSDTNEPPYTTPARNGFLDVIVGEALRRLGYELRLVKLPPERGLINANAGIEDGDLTRIAGIEKLYPNLVRVPEKVMDWEFAAFSKDASIPSNWLGLRPRSVGHIKGWKIYEQNFAGAERVSTADDPYQLFRLLDLNRIEVALYERWIGLAFLKQQGLKGIQPLAPMLATREMFIYLHQRHAALAPKLADSLRAMKREGIYQQAYFDMLKPYRESTVR